MTTDPGRWDRVTAAFGLLAELGAAERQAGLDALAVTDPAIHDEVVSLLASSDAVGDRFDQPTFAGAPDESDQPSLSGRRIGPYLISREIGRGGMGAVWEAQRADDQYQKRVAIKMVVMGRDTESMLRRFRVERELLARLDHGNIATLLDGGVTEEGQPWFAMEYIEGEPITTWCATNRLSVRQRVELFRQVCAATQYAHEHLVVHRDLKPTNILVAHDGTVKLLDFGVAKLTDPGDPDAGLTSTAGIALTAAYASPEQLRGESVSTASDVYSLGVVLYELLTGIRPFTGLPGNTAERTANPPSRAVTVETAAAMGTEGVRRVSQALQGDLDAVVLTALRPEVARRYRSVEQFSDDLQRALDGRQVSARPDTLGYRVSTLVRRNRAAAALAVVAVSALLGATGFSIREAAMARAERDRAVLETARTRQVTQFFQDVLSSARPDRQGGNVTIAQAIDSAIVRADSAFTGQPDLRAAIKLTLGATLTNMYHYQRAKPLLEDALRYRRQVDGDTPSMDKVDALFNLAAIEAEVGDRTKAESLYRASLAMRGKVTPGDSSKIYEGLGNVAEAMLNGGKLKESIALYDTVARALDRLRPGDIELRGTTRANLGTAMSQLGRYAEAEPVLREAAKLAEQARGPNDPSVASALQPLAGTLIFNGKYAEAEQVARRAVAIDEKEFGRSNPATVSALRMVTAAMIEEGRCPEALPLIREMLALRGKVMAETDPTLGVALLQLGQCQATNGELAASEASLRDALTVRIATFGPTHWAVGQIQSMLGEVLGRRRNDVEAEKLLRAGYASLKAGLAPGHLRTEQARIRLEGFLKVRDRSSEIPPP